MSRTLVNRCQLCGAPLPAVDGYVVACSFCGESNRLVSEEIEDAQRQSASIQKASAEARAMAPDVEATSERLQAEWVDSHARYLVGDAEKAEVLRRYEAVLRINYVPSVHIAQQMGDAGEAMLAELDAAVAAAVAKYESNPDAFPR